jgi:hypothetical protein
MSDLWSDGQEKQMHEAWSLTLHGCIFQHSNWMWGQEFWFANPLVQELVSGSGISFELVLLTINSLTAKSILVGEKLVILGRCILNYYIGIVHYILRETETWCAKVYLPTQLTNL